MPSFKEELTALINIHSREGESDTPDWILAQYMLGSLVAFESAIGAREEWYGRKTSDGEESDE